MERHNLARLQSNTQPLVINGAGVVGEAVLALCQRHGITVAGVCDSSVKTVGSDFRGYLVRQTRTLKQDFPDALVLITAAAIHDVVQTLQAQGLDDWIAAGPLLEDFDIAQDAPELDDRKFSIENAIICHRGYLVPEGAFLRSVDLIITERCSLKCRDCSNLMQYYERPQNVDLDLLYRSVDALCATMDEIMELRVIGGDAFMHKHWPDIVQRLLDQPKVRRVVVYTNGTLLPKPEQALVLAHPKALTVVTDYGPLSPKLSALKVLFAEHGIAHRILKPDTWLDCASLAKHNRPPTEHRRIYQECCAKNMLSLSDGKLFHCPFAANADRLGAVPDLPGDYVDLLAAPGDADGLHRLRSRIVDYLLHTKELAVCDWCNGRPLSGQDVVPAIQTDKPLAYQKYPRADMGTLT